MKRSVVNAEIKIAKQLLKENSITLPKLAYWDMEDFINNKESLSTIREIKLGWDVTDFGTDDYDRVGGVLYTVRNGVMKEKLCGVPYAEKYIILKEGQSLPMHFHFLKTEDIINRAGGILALKLFNADKNYDIDTNSEIKVLIDGILHCFEPGEIIEIPVGSSITLHPMLYHTFWAMQGFGPLIVGEVSSLNNDKTDNYFNPPLDRYSEIEEDEEAICLLCNEYEKLF